ncbi:hypothetical protein PR048_001092 [Dryococelus australis]|uniref:Trafficking protein particle complex subunit 4 n=1 Tax=Dryococelus australis TaxID=614101 RepID=A0ABQ9IGI0_9NEOP|nr:hypothetical protein PR048_001092 [Dryococelus australis]
MVIYGVYIVSKSGGLIFNHENNVPKIETEKTFSYPLNIKLNYENKKIVVDFGQRDGIMGKFTLLSEMFYFIKVRTMTQVIRSPCSVVQMKCRNDFLRDNPAYLIETASLTCYNRDTSVVINPERASISPVIQHTEVMRGTEESSTSLTQACINLGIMPDNAVVGHVLLAVNGIPVTGRQLDDSRDVFEVLDNPENFPLDLKFGRPRMTTNEKIFLASMFYPLFAIASQLSPEPRSSGIEVLEADTFRLHCFQTLTGVKFMVVAEPNQGGLEALLKKIYELYADYALKNPFYSLEMPIRCELFDSHLQHLLEHVERTGITYV